MRFIDTLCPPALLYLLFVTIQVALDLSLGMLITAGVKTAMGLIVVFALDALCGVDLGVVSWVIVATPFIVTSLATAIALGLDLDRVVSTKVKETFYESPDGEYYEGEEDGEYYEGEEEGEYYEEEDMMAEEEFVDYPFSTSSPIQ